MFQKSILIIFIVFSLALPLFSQSGVGYKYDPDTNPNNIQSPLLKPNTNETEWSVANSILTDRYWYSSNEYYKSYYDSIALGPYSNTEYLKIQNDSFIEIYSGKRLTVITHGFIYLIDFTTSYMLVNVVQKKNGNCEELAGNISINGDRSLYSFKIYLNNFEYDKVHIKEFNGESSGRVMLAKTDDSEFRFIITADDIIMMKINRAITNIVSDLKFHPGYFGKSKPISNTKSGYSALMLDNYGGYGVYIFPDISSITTISDSSTLRTSDRNLPTLSITNVQSKDIIWLASCPPKKYNWDNLSKKAVCHIGCFEIDSDRPAERCVYPVKKIPPVGTATEPTYKIDPTYMNYLKNYDIVINGHHMSTYKNWHFGYTPRNIPYDSLNKVLEALQKESANRVLLYTSPGMYFKNSRFSNEDSTIKNPKSPIYGHQYYLDKPLINYMDANGALIDTFPLFTTYWDFNNNWFWKARERVPIDNPGNPLGTNYDSYMLEIDTLLYKMNNLTGIYMDWYYYLNIPRMYMLAKELRYMVNIWHPKQNFLYAHSHNLPGGDAYLPQIDMYFDAILRGESGTANYKDYLYYRYYCSGYNISNTQAYFIEDKDASNTEWVLRDQFPTSYFKYSNLGYRYQAPQMMNESLYNQGEIRTNYSDKRFGDVNSLYDYYSSTNQAILKKNLQNWYAEEQDKYRAQDSSLAPRYLNVNDKFFTGDFNGDGVGDILRIDEAGNIFVRAKYPNPNIYLLNREVNWGSIPGYSINDKIVLGDFDGDKISEFLHLKYCDSKNSSSAVWSLYKAEHKVISDGLTSIEMVFNYKGNWLKFPGGGIYSWWQPNDLISPVKRNADKNDVVKVSPAAGTIEVIGNDVSGNTSYKVIQNFNYEKGYQGGAKDVFLCGDLNRDGYTDVLVLAAIADNGILDRYVPYAFIYDKVNKFGKGPNTATDNMYSPNNDRTPDYIYANSRNGIKFGFAKVQRTSNDNLIYISKSTNNSSLYYAYTYDGYYFNEVKAKSHEFGSAGGATPTDIVVADNNTILFSDTDKDSLDDIFIMQPQENRVIFAQSQYDSGNWLYGLCTDLNFRDHQRMQKELSGMTEQVPRDYNLSQNYPNPFNPVTRINYEIPSRCKVELKIYDIMGREVKILENDIKEPGRYSITFDASNLPSGIYIYHLNAGSYSTTSKMVLLK
ncbi:MAG: T9SS type A sorting domain-containing protein [Ignavibacteria bacterium]|jgi:hypothetical protein|nr:T9SS type A sorting domain-containing protein [Ignavibacteria bacterium]MCU7501508.1 T9SS type A sorting domain-containing protein [Ignavibacteria bacterium]MCU7515976.1 T9SS type A sorting domain-containing protein [Ignavibacteria bacterium]